MTYQMTLHDLFVAFTTMFGLSLLLLLTLVVWIVRKVMRAERRIFVDPPATPRTTTARWRPTVSDWHTRVRLKAMEK